MLACAIIYYNGFSILRDAFHEILDGQAGSDVHSFVIGLAGAVPGVVDVEKCRIRKSGIDYFVEIHVRVPPAMPVCEGHAVGHRVKDTLIAHRGAIRDVVVHLEPAE